MSKTVINSTSVAKGLEVALRDMLGNSPVTIDRNGPIILAAYEGADTYDAIRYDSARQVLVVRTYKEIDKHNATLESKSEITIDELFKKALDIRVNHLESASA